MNFKIPIWTILASVISLTSWCGWKYEPQAFQITINTEGKVAGIVMPRNWPAICQKWLENLPKVANVDELSEQYSFQHKGSSAGFLDQKRLSTNTSPENLYIFVKNDAGEKILRVINRGWNGTKKLYNQEEIDRAMKESCW